MQYESTELRPTTQDLTGKTFERLTVQHFAGYRNLYDSYWTCQCICGITKDVAGTNLKRGLVRSCGCLNSEKSSERKITHGRSQTLEHHCWKGMIQRCENPNHHKYKTYGGRGVTVSEAWHNFATFYADMGPKPTPRHSIERLRNDEGYSRENCVWATSRVQSRNTRTNMFLTYNGITMCAEDWAIAIGMKSSALRARIYRGWSVEEALTIPNTGKNRKNMRKKFIINDPI